MKARIPVAVLLLACCALATPRHAQGQIRSRVQEAARRALEAKEKASADSAKAKAAADSAKAKAAADSAKAKAPADGGTGSRPDPKVWDNYDFVPGNKVIVFTDFSDDKVGNFARRLKYVGGPMDVVERDGVRMLRATGPATFLIPVGRELPERFTLEFDIIVPPGSPNDVLMFEGGPQRQRTDESAEILWHQGGTYILGSGQNMGNSHSGIPEAMQPLIEGHLAHVRVLMDGAYFKMYTNERRMYNIPEFAFKRDSVIRVFLKGAEEPGREVYLAGVRLAESETDVLYDALAANGRWATQGILFATGMAELQPESRPVLKEIAATLKEHGDLKILIEGHTDNVGNAASNLALSDARAAAVKAALVTDFAIDGERITTKGFGDTKPAVPNTTPEGKAQNRRVEIVKL